MTGSKHGPMGKRNPTAPTVRQRLQRSIAARRGEVILRRDLKKDLGSRSQVNRSLKQLQEEDKLVRIGNGVYAKATASPLSGRPASRQGLEVLAAETLDRLGIGLTTQVPWRTTFDTGRRRISRRLQWAKLR